MTGHTRDVAIARGGIDLAGRVHLPADFDEGHRHAAIVVATPGSSVKEQIAAVYGSRLAGRGLVVLTFDPAYQGRSGGEPRDLEDPYARAEDIRCAVDHLVAQRYIDPSRIGILGICAGGGYADEIAQHRTAAARGGDDVRIPWIPDTMEEAQAQGISDIDLLEGDPVLPHAAWLQRALDQPPPVPK